MRDFFDVLTSLVGGGGGDRGAGARENREREGYGRREKEGREVGDLRGREAGEKCGTLINLIQQCVTKLLKSRTQNIFDLHLTSSQSLLRLLSKTSKRKFALGLKNRLISSEMVNPFTVVTS